MPVDRGLVCVLLTAGQTSAAAWRHRAAAERYFGQEQGQVWIQQVRGIMSTMVKVTIAPEWVGVLDFQTRFPSAISA